MTPPPVRLVPDDERRARLARRHHLSTPAHDVVDVASDMAGLHATDPASVYLAAWARVSDFAREDLEQALYDDRRLLRVLGMRRTMFVVPPEMAAAIDVACAAIYGERERRKTAELIAEQGIADAAEKWLDRVADATVAALRERGEATAVQLREAVPELTETLTFGEGRKWAGTIGLSTRVLFLLATEGRIVRGRPLGSWLSSQYRWAVTEDWLGGPFDVPDPDDAARHVARCWLRSFGPGTERDLQWWTGWGVRDTRRVLAEIGAVPVETAAGPAHLLPEDDDVVPPTPSWVALLPGLDPTTMGWKERDWYLGDHAASLFDRNGNAGPTVWVDGRIVGGWAQRPEGEVVFRLLEDVGSETTTRIEETAARLGTWLGEHRVKARFRTPLERELGT